MENTTTPRATHAPPSKLRFMCSYNGHILPRPHDKTLTYMGGVTRLITLPHTNATTLQTLISQILKTTSFDKTIPFVIKYQLPNEDLDSLVSVSTDEDLEYMIDEYYYYLNNNENNNNLNNSSNRLRLFLFPRNSDSVVESVKSIGSVLLEGSEKSEEVFVRGLNGRLSSCLSFCSDNNSLLGLEDDVIKGNGEVPEFGSVPDSPVKVNAEANYVAVQAVPVKVDGEVKEEGNYVAAQAPVVGNGLGQRVASGGFDMASPDLVLSDGSLTNPLSRRNPTVIYQDAATQTLYSNNNNGVTHDPNTRIQMQQQQINAATQTQYSDNNNNRVIDDQNSRAQMQQQQFHDSAYLRSTSTAAVTTTTTPTDLQHPQAHQQHQFTHTADPSIVNDQNTKIHLQPQQIQDSASLTSTAATKPDLQHPQVHQQHQFIHTAVPPPQYIHHHPSGAVPMPSYYPMYPPQTQHHGPVSALDQRKIVYYMPVISPPPNSQVPTPSSLFTTPRTAQPASNPESPVYRTNSSGASGPQFVQPQPQYVAYSHIQQPSQAVGSSAGTVHPSSKPESPVYRTNSSDASGPQFVQFPSTQHQHQPQPQYVAYSHIQQPSQGVPSSGGSGGNYAYEFADLSEKGQLIYYAAQPMPPQSSAQYQTTSSNLPVEGGSHIQTESSMNQQVKTSQP